MSRGLGKSQIARGGKKPKRTDFRGGHVMRNAKTSTVASEDISMGMTIRGFISLFIFFALICPAIGRAQGEPVPPASGFPGSGGFSGMEESPSPLAADQILIRYKEATPESVRASICARIGARVLREFRNLGELQLVSLPDGMTAPAAIKRLRQQPEVLYAEPDYRVTPQAVPDDPEFPSQWGLDSSAYAGDIDAPEAWDITTGSKDVVIAVIDSGIDYTHPDLADNLFHNIEECDGDGIDDDGNGYTDDCHGINTREWNSDPWDDDSHGTAVAGVIGAVGNNSIGIAGVNWNVSLLPCRFFDVDGYGTLAGVIGCLDYVAEMKDRGINIVASNNSWNGGVHSQALHDAIRAQMERGILFITSARHNGQDNDKNLIYPCAYDLSNIICTGATMAGDYYAQNSNYGRTTVHLDAPGSNIRSTVPGFYGGYAALDGTSMSAAFVSGVAGLIAADRPGSDWREIRNRILAGGDGMYAKRTISNRRLNANGALTCSDGVVLGRTRPHGSALTTGIVPMDVSVLHIDCSGGHGDVEITVMPTNEVITLLDDGKGSDLLANDGVYSSSWTPPAGGDYVLMFPNDDPVAVTVDADLQPGFPAKVFSAGGGATVPLIANIDGGPGYQILVSVGVGGDINAFNSDGSTVPGWPIYTGVGTTIAAGEISGESEGDEIFMSDITGYLWAVDGSGYLLPGWPIEPGHSAGEIFLLADITGDERDEILIGGLLARAFSADGGLFRQFNPISDTGHDLGVIDLDLDGDLEIIKPGELLGSSEPEIRAWHHTGDYVAGFPAPNEGLADFVLGDVDGDGFPEIVGVGSYFEEDAGWAPRVSIYGHEGSLEKSVVLHGYSQLTSLAALADLDADGILEILFQTDDALHVLRGDGTYFPGWPVEWDEYTRKGHSAPVVGDVDGDQYPDIVVSTMEAGGGTGSVHVFNRSGGIHPHFPKDLPIGFGSIPAIGDIDADGHNEIVIVSSEEIYFGYEDAIWAYDLGGPSHGPVLWGQAMGNSRRTHSPLTIYPSPNVYRSLDLTHGGGGKVVIAPTGKDCVNDCVEYLEEGVTATLTATGDIHYRFDGWDGACAGHMGNVCSVGMDSDKSVSIRFVRTHYLLAVVMSGLGSGSVSAIPGGIQCGETCSEWIAAGAQITLTAVAVSGSIFSGWSGACSGSASKCTLTVSGDSAVTATFRKQSSSTGGTGGTGGTGNKSGGGCFIATAAYGSYMADDVRVLRRFRDQFLLTNRGGRAFVRWYYRYSPPVAGIISSRPWLRTLTRMALMPIVFMIKYPLAVFPIFLVFGGFPVLAWDKRRMYKRNRV